MVPCGQLSLDKQASGDRVQTPTEGTSKSTNSPASGGSLPVDVPLSSLALPLRSYCDSFSSAAHEVP